MGHSRTERVEKTIMSWFPKRTPMASLPLCHKDMKYSQYKSWNTERIRKWYRNGDLDFIEAYRGEQFP